MRFCRFLVSLPLVVAVGICGCAAPGPEARPRLPVTTPQDVAERLKEVGAAAPDPVPLPSYEPAPYVAFSLRAAQAKLEGRATSNDYHSYLPEVYYLGGINRIKGAVYDRELDDLILVGARELDRPPLTLDDLVVALRSRFVHGEWPLVSIDPMPETAKTQIQHVRYEGGIRNMPFGRDMFDADLRLKTIGLGLLDSGVLGLKTYWDLNVEEIKQGRVHREFAISARFWFYPACPSVAVREDVVAIKGLKVSVFTEVLSAVLDGQPVGDLTTFRDPTGDEFARQVSEHYPALGKAHRSIGRLAGLLELVALAHAVEQMSDQPDLSYWLKNYAVKQQPTPKQQEVLRRRWDYEFPDTQGFYEASGGVHLTALALRLQAGDVTALKEAVLATRPSPDVLLWTFIVGDWVIPTSPGMLKLEDLAGLFTHALFLQTNERYSHAITMYDRIIELKPDFAEAYNDRAIAYRRKGAYNRAIADYDQAVALKPGYAGAYYNRGILYDDMGDYDRAIADYSEAIVLKPEYADAYYNRGLAYVHKGEYDIAIADFTKTTGLEPDFVEAYNECGEAYRQKGDYDRAITTFTKAIDLKPDYADPYNNRGIVYCQQDEYDQAIADFNKAIDLNADCAEAYNNRGLAYHDKAMYDPAVADYDKAIALKPDYAEAYYNRGRTYHDKAAYDRAIADYNRSIALKPDYAEAYNNRGITYIAGKREYDRAIEDLDRAISLKADYAEAYSNRGIAYRRKGAYEGAINNFNESIRLKPDHVEAYNNRGIAYCQKGEYVRAIADYDKTIALKPTSPEPYNNRGIVHYKKGEYDSAIADYDKAIALKPDYAEAYYHRGFAYAKKGNNAQARRDWEQAAKLDPTGPVGREAQRSLRVLPLGKHMHLPYRDAETYNKRGLAYLHGGEFDRAIQDFTTAIDLDPGLAQPYYNRGLAWYQKGEYNRAIADYSKAITLSPNRSEPYTNRGGAYCKKGDYDLAITDYNKAITLKPGAADTYYSRGNAYYRKNEYTEARSDWRQAVKLDPSGDVGSMAQRNLQVLLPMKTSDPAVYQLRGDSHYLAGQYDRAIAAYTKAIALNPGFAEAYYNRAVAYYRKGEYDRAISDSAKAIHLKPDYLEAYCNRGNAYAEKREYDRAIADYTTAISLKSDYAEAFDWRGSAYADRGDYDLAIADYSKAIDLKLDFAVAYCNRGNAYAEGKRDYSRARQDWEQAVKLAPADSAGRLAQRNLRILGQVGH